MKSIAAALLLLLLAGACGGAAGADQSLPDRSLTVFASASLVEAFAEIQVRFEAQHPGVKVIYNLAGTQQLAQQLVQGAQADVFASANLQQMEAVIQAGQVEAGTVEAFARNRLVVVFSGEYAREDPTLQDLRQPGLSLVLAAPEVPAGQYAQEFLARAAADPVLGPEFQDDVLDNVVSYEENVRAVLSKVLLGEADAGIVYSSDISPENAADLHLVEIPAELNTPAKYYVAPLSGTAQADLARAFIAFLLSGAGQEILQNYGFLPLR